MADDEGIEARNDNETGVTYFYSHHTGETSWSRNDLIKNDATGSDPDVVRKRTNSNRIYFENTRTKKTGWLKADVVEPETASAQANSQANASEETPSPAKAKKRTGMKDPIKHREFVKEGYMLRKASKLQSWARRWFKLDANHKQLLYYKSNDNPQLKGIIDLAGVLIGHASVFASLTDILLLFAVIC